jgi:hypothetical protein
MGHAEALIGCDRAVLRAYSRHTSQMLRQRLAVNISLPWLERFLELNVGKEMEKDRRVIQRARDLADSHTEPGQDDVAGLLATARAVDRDFLRHTAHLPFEIPIPYHAIEPIRARRMERLLYLAHRILLAWEPGMKTRQAIGTAMSPQEVEAAIAKLLILYAEETRHICEALPLPLLLRPLRDQLAHGLFDVMAAAAGTLSRQASMAIYRR